MALFARLNLPREVFGLSPTPCLIGSGFSEFVMLRQALRSLIMQLRFVAGLILLRCVRAEPDTMSDLAVAF